MLVRRPAHGGEVGDLLLVGAVRLHRPDVGDQPVLLEVTPDDAAVLGEEGAAVVTGPVGEALLLSAVGLHDVDLGEERRVERELLLLGRRQRAVVGVAHRREHDPLAIRGVAAFGVVALRRGQLLHGAGLLAIREDVHLRVVVPCVAAFLARGAEVEFVLLVLQRLGIEVRRAEHDLVAAGTEERARRLAHAGRDSLGVAGGEVEHEDLVERVGRVTLALEDQALAVGRPVAFTRALALDRQPADAAQEGPLTRRGLRGHWHCRPQEHGRRTQRHGGNYSLRQDVRHLVPTNRSIPFYWPRRVGGTEVPPSWLTSFAR